MALHYHPDLLAPFLALPQGDSIQAECTYCSAVFPRILLLSCLLDVWIGGHNELRSKSRVGNFIFTAMIPLFVEYDHSPLRRSPTGLLKSPSSPIGTSMVPPPTKHLAMTRMFTFVLLQCLKIRSVVVTT
jgi:hypothetical protein